MKRLRGTSIRKDWGHNSVLEEKGFNQLCTLFFMAQSPIHPRRVQGDLNKICRELHHLLSLRILHRCQRDQHSSEAYEKYQLVQQDDGTIQS